MRRVFMIHRDERCLIAGCGQLTRDGRFCSAHMFRGPLIKSPDKTSVWPWILLILVSYGMAFVLAR